MLSTAESISHATGSAALSHLMVLDDDPGRSAEVAAALSSFGIETIQTGPSAGAAEALRRDRPAVAVVSEQALAAASQAGGLREAAAELGVPLLVVVDEPGDAADALADADDWVSRRSLAAELPARVARLLKRRAANGAPARGDSGLPADPQFFALVVHDLRTPLNVIGLSLRMISQAVPKGDPDLEEDLRFVDENFRQIERMLAQLSDFYRLFELEGQLTPSPFSPKRLVEELVEVRAGKAGLRTSPVIVEALPTCPDEVDLDQIRARMAIQYVLANATASANGEPVRLTLRGGDDRWVIEAAVDLPPPSSVKPVTLSSKAFERLCGFAAERRGMDLAIAAKVSELFGGQARLEVEESQGTTVVLDWPTRLPSLDRPGTTLTRPFDA